ncbi:MAG: acyl-CoA dehydrogenase family protein [Thermoprotei archaeon]
MVLPFSGVDLFSVGVSEEYEAFRKSVREFLERDVRPHVARGEKEGSVPYEVFRKLGEAGLIGVGVPEEYGGQGGDPLMLAIATEEITRVWPSLATRVGGSGLFTIMLMYYGNDAQRKKYLPAIVRGEKIGALANTEPTAGSDVAGIQSVAKKGGGKYVLNGRKIFITNGGIADYYVVSARTSSADPSARWRGLSVFIVEKGQPGFRVVGRVDTMGLRASNTAELSFEDVEVPEENLVGEEGVGFKYMVGTFNRARVGTAAQGVGVAQAALEAMVSYSLQRKAFDSPLVGFQMVQEKISDTMIEVNAARLLTYWAASLWTKGRENEAIIAASMAKTYATDAAERAAIRAITVHGGYGVSTDTGVERLLRDVEVMKIYEGANDIQRLTILRESARRLLGIKM